MSASTKLLLTLVFALLLLRNLKEIYVMSRSPPPEGSMITSAWFSRVIRLDRRRKVMLVHQVTSVIKTTFGSHLFNKMEMGASSAHVKRVNK